jgi:hypothetical protein
MIKKLRNQPYAPKNWNKLPNGSKEEKIKIKKSSNLGRHADYPDWPPF